MLANKLTNSDPFVLNWTCDCLINVGWPQWSSCTATPHNQSSELIRLFQRTICQLYMHCITMQVFIFDSVHVFSNSTMISWNGCFYWLFAPWQTQWHYIYPISPAVCVKIADFVNLCLQKKNSWIGLWFLVKFSPWFMSQHKATCKEIYLLNISQLGLFFQEFSH